MAIQTRLEDMVIGDKIGARWHSASLSKDPNKHFFDFGYTGNPSTSVVSFNSGSSFYFYFIYVGNDFKGRKILVADRNVAHTISWDDLNLLGYATKDGAEITSLGLDPTQWKTNIRLLTGGISAATAANSEWDKYIVNGPVGTDNATWNWSGLVSATSTTIKSGTYSSGDSNMRVGRGNGSVSGFNYHFSDTANTTWGFRPVLVAESLTQPIQNKFLIQDGEEIKTWKLGYDIGISPIMTSANAPSPFIVDASTQQSGGSEAWRAFDGTNSNWAATGSAPQWLRIDLGEQKIVNNYSLKNFAAAITTSPKSFKIEGSNDNSLWDVLDSRTGIVWDGSGAAKEFSFANSTAYRYYRITVTETQGASSTNVFINEVTLGGKTESSWQVIGPAPATKAMFDQGMEDLSILTEENLSQLSSATPELLCWTDEVEPTRHIKQTVNDWLTVSSDMPTEEIFLAEGMSDFNISSEAWDAFESDFDVVSYTNAESLEADVQATSKGRLILATTDFSQIEDLTITASGEKTRIILSGDGGTEWKVYSEGWTAINPTPEDVALQGMTVATFNALTLDQFAELGKDLRLGYYIEDTSLIESIALTKSPVATETPTLDSVKLTYDELTIEGRLKDIEQINAINMAKLQFKANALMQSSKYKLHDLVVDTFEEDSMETIESSLGTEEVTLPVTSHSAHDGGFITVTKVETTKVIKGIEVI